MLNNKFIDIRTFSWLYPYKTAVYRTFLAHIRTIHDIYPTVSHLYPQNKTYYHPYPQQKTTSSKDEVVFVFIYYHSIRMETAGVEPASRGSYTRASTRVVCQLGFAHHFAGKLGGLCAILRISSGYLRRE